MRLRGRGLLVGSTDSNLYVPRERLELALLEPMLSGGNILLLGGRGTGKTTSLRKLAFDLRNQDREVAWINASLAGSASELLALVAEALTIAPIRVSDDASAAELAAAVRNLAGAPPTCLLIDGPLPAGAARALFVRLRDELWALEHQWAVTSGSSRISDLRLPPADVFWDQTIPIPALTSSEVEELLSRGLNAEERAELQRLHWKPPEPAWPRDVVRGVREIIDGGYVVETADEVTRLQAVRNELDRVPSMILAELESLHRPAAANDSELLERLGYSRAYIARGLADLEQKGLVAAEFESTEGRSGRPRKLYEPVLNGVIP